MSGAYIKVTKTYVEPWGTHYLGTNINIGAILDDIPSATTATITIDDPGEVAKVEDVSMTQTEDYVYEYTLQSVSTWNDGTYIATITITNGDYTYVHQIKFELLEQL